jgi:hypothetical protein
VRVNEASGSLKALDAEGLQPIGDALAFSCTDLLLMVREVRDRRFMADRKVNTEQLARAQAGECNCCFAQRLTCRVPVMTPAPPT